MTVLSKCTDLYTSKYEHLLFLGDFNAGIENASGKKFCNSFIITIIKIQNSKHFRYRKRTMRLSWRHPTENVALKSWNRGIVYISISTYSENRYFKVFPAMIYNFQEFLVYFQ